MHIFLVRHSRPLGTEGICYGRLDVEVDDAGASGAAAFAAAQVPPEILCQARLHCSPSTRCTRLARLLSAPHEPLYSEHLREMDFGSWEGIPWSEVPRAELDAWAANLWTYRPGGGESAQMVAARWQAWLHDVRHSGCGSALAVTHAGVIRVALAQHAANPSAALTQQIPYASVHRLEI
jgi:alpha-ribazole phosphatase